MNTYRIRSYYGWQLDKEGNPAMFIGYRTAISFLRSLRASGDGAARLVKWEN